MVIEPLLAGLASMAVAGFLRLFAHHFRMRTQPRKPYAERLEELTISLTNATREVDAVLAELDQVAKSRQKGVDELEANLSSLESKEKGLKAKIEALEKTPIPVADHFAKLLEAGEKRSTKRDYALFGAGVIVTTAIAIIIQTFAG